MALSKIKTSPFIKNYLITAGVTAFSLTYMASITSFVMKEDYLSMPLIAGTTAFLIPFLMKYREKNLEKINGRNQENKINNENNPSLLI